MWGPSYLGMTRETALGMNMGNSPWHEHGKQPLAREANSPKLLQSILQTTNANSWAVLHLYYYQSTQDGIYTGITNDLAIRAAQHQWDALFGGEHFTGKYQAFYVIY